MVIVAGNGIGDPKLKPEWDGFWIHINFIENPSVFTFPTLFFICG